MSTIILFGITIFILIVSMKKDKTKTISSMKKARGMMRSMLSDIIGILLLIGLIITIIPLESIEKVLGSDSNPITIFFSAVIGTITLIPAFVAFPLIGSLRDNGGGIVALTAFLTTLTMVGFVTLPLEIKTFSKKFAFYRNLLSFTLAVCIALIMGVVL